MGDFLLPPSPLPPPFFPPPVDQLRSDLANPWRFRADFFLVVNVGWDVGTKNDALFMLDSATLIKKKTAQQLMNVSQLCRLILRPCLPE
jgi:hypothetical protein